MKLSIVTTLYKSKDNIKEFYERTTRAATKINCTDYEIIFVNDGSPDDGLEIAIELSTNDDKITIIDLSRNFGHHKAIMTGLHRAKGDFIFLIDSDLEESPEWLESFWTKMQADDCDVIYGVQKRRKGNAFEQISGEIFWKLINLLSGLNMPANICTARLMNKKYVDALITHQEHEIFIAGLWHITGFNQQPFLVNKLNNGKSTYTLKRKFGLLINSITSFSNLPLIGIFYIGITIFTFASIYSSFLIFKWVFLSKPLAGWTSVMASIWLLGGIVISFMGIIGIYISKIFSETKNRPYTIIREIYGK